MAKKDATLHSLQTLLIKRIMLKLQEGRRKRVDIFQLQWEPGKYIPPKRWHFHSKHMCDSQLPCSIFPPVESLATLLFSITCKVTDPTSDWVCRGSDSIKTLCLISRRWVQHLSRINHVLRSIKNIYCMKNNYRIAKLTNMTKDTHDLFKLKKYGKH